jgi:hypothetical protein
MNHELIIMNCMDLCFHPKSFDVQYVVRLVEDIEYKSAYRNLYVVFLRKIGRILFENRVCSIYRLVESFYSIGCGEFFRRIKSKLKV